MNQNLGALYGAPLINRNHKMRNCIEEQIEQHKLWLNSHGKHGKRLVVIDRKFEHESFVFRDLKGAGFIRCTFFDCNFDKAEMDHVKIHNCKFLECHLGANSCFRKAHITRTSFKYCILQNSEFIFATLNSTCFKRCSLHYTSFMGARIYSCLFEHCSASSVHILQAQVYDSLFLETDLNNSCFFRSRISDTKFSFCNMANMDLHLVRFEDTDLDSFPLKQPLLCNIIPDDRLAAQLLLQVCLFDSSRMSKEMRRAFNQLRTPELMALVKEICSK